MKNSKMKNYLVFDIGGTFIKYALMDKETNILEKDKIPTPWYENHTKEDFYEALDHIIGQYHNRISGIAFSIPGILNPVNGCLVTAGYLPYLIGCKLNEELSSRYSLPVTAENDGKCAALAEYWKGSLKGYDNGAVVILGSGVAGGIILNGKLIHGNHFFAGEYSFLCTRSNISESLDSYWGIWGGAKGLVSRVSGYMETDKAELDGIRIFRMANAGNKKVLQGLSDFTNELAVQIYNLNILLDLDIIAIGGGISRQPLLYEYLQKSLNNVINNNPLKKFADYVPIPRITNCHFYNDANLIGALYHYQDLERSINL